MWHIRNLEIKNRVVVGPMAGVSNIAFRTIAKEFGAGLIYTEMVSDKALVYQNQKTIKMTEVHPNEHPLSMQLFGEDVESMVKAAQFLDQHTECDIIDINMGCPAPKIIKGSGGASLMKRPDHAFEIVQQIVANVSKPVTVKIRSGWDVHHINAVEMAIGIEKAGASALAIHGRTKTQMYQGEVDLDIIKAVKEAISIPVIGNGNIFNAQNAKHMLEYTGCDAIMIARGVLGNPWLIQEILAILDLNQEGLSISYHQRLQWALTHAQRLIECKGETIGIKEMRGHASWYISGLPYSHRVKNQFSQMTSLAEFVTLIEKYRDDLNQLTSESE